MGHIFALFLLIFSVVPSWAQPDNLGYISFPTSGSAEAQPHFLRGVIFLHSFGWKQAITEFREAQRLDPDFVMAYWGETLCYNHPLANERDADSPRAVLARLGPTPAARLAKAPTDREKGFLQAVEILWGDGAWRARRIAYMNAMDRLAAKYPDDDEVEAFRAIAMLSGARALDDNTQRYEVKAGSIALDILRHNPNHPGALHYTIHAFDDPIHAPLALDAARKYAAIVPDVSHAVHMPSHIFIQLGMWQQVAAQNVRALEIARDLFEPGDDAGDMVHSGDLAQYGYLQLGDEAGANAQLAALEAEFAQSKNRGLARVIERMKARDIIETENWAVQPVADDAAPETIFVNGMSAAHLGDADVAAQMLELLARRESPRVERLGLGALAAMAGMDDDDMGMNRMGGPPAGGGRNVRVRIMRRELAATMEMAAGRSDRAIALATEAVEIEDGMGPPLGAADPIKPARELLGDVLFAAGLPTEAAATFDANLLHMPNRARSLMGAAQAYAAAGEADLADERYRSLEAFWVGAPVAPPNVLVR